MGEWIPPKIWQGGRCFIIGGGHSVFRQFEIPEELIKKVLQRQEYLRAYSPYMELLHKEHIIGINQAFRLGGWVDMMFFGDDSFWSKNAEDGCKWPNLKVHSSNRSFKGIKRMKRDNKKKKGISTRPGFVSWNGNSGSAAISLAAQLGVKQIILLGFDMNQLPHGTHWHGLYGKKNKEKAERTFKNHMKGFPHIAKDAKQLGIEILNASPDSRIDDFKKVSIKDVV